MGIYRREYKTKDGIKTAKNWSYEFYIDNERFQGTIKDSDKFTKKQAEVECDRLKQSEIDSRKDVAKVYSYDDGMLAFYQIYLERLTKRRSSTHKNIKDSYAHIIGNLESHFTGKALNAVLRADVVNYILFRRRQGVSDKTIKNEVNCLSSMYSTAESIGMCDYRDYPNFSSIKKMLKVSKPKTNYLTREDFDNIVAEMSGNIKFFTEFDVETGLRMEELLSLRRIDIDWSRPGIRVPDTKNGKDRFVPLSSRAVELLQKQLQETKRIKTDYIICNKDGTRLVWIEGTFKRACAKARVKCSIHDLRRTFGSWRLQGIRGKKLDIKQVSLLLGHSDTRITESTYAFLNEEEIKL